jgi:hypothetical protein
MVTPLDSIIVIDQRIYVSFIGLSSTGSRIGNRFWCLSENSFGCFVGASPTKHPKEFSDRFFESAAMRRPRRPAT